LGVPRWIQAVVATAQAAVGRRYAAPDAPAVPLPPGRPPPPGPSTTAMRALAAAALSLAVAPLALAAAFGAPAAASVSAAAGGLGAHGASDRLYLPGANVLVFVAGQMTFSRRGTPRLQLECVGGDAKHDDEEQPVHVDCYNEGVRPPLSEYERAHPVLRWTCIRARRSRTTEMRDWRVVCEGYAYAEDLFVVKGSCWLEYKLFYTGEEEGEEEEVLESEGAGVDVLGAVRLGLVLVAMYGLAFAARRCAAMETRRGETDALLVRAGGAR
jgi:hypothetical protein